MLICMNEHMHVHGTPLMLICMNEHMHVHGKVMSMCMNCHVHAWHVHESPHFMQGVHYKKKGVLDAFLDTNG